MNGAGEKSVCSALVGMHDGKDHSEDLDVDGRM
jgi:hypothetical protein